MTDTRFAELLDIYGADFERWPEPERAAGRHWLEQSAEAQRAWREERHVAAALEAWDVPGASFELVSAVTHIPLRMPAANTEASITDKGTPSTVSSARPVDSVSVRRRRDRRATFVMSLGVGAMAGLGFFVGAWTAPLTLEISENVGATERGAEVDTLPAGDEEFGLDELALASGFEEDGEE